MTDYQKQTEAIEKILKSAGFKDSTRYQELLKYLVTAHKNNDAVKEVSIAKDLFDKPDFDPHEDPSIRVYISNLRKKLKLYYLSDGKNENPRIEIPKGHYDLKFVQVDAPKAKYKFLLYAVALPIILVLISIIIYQQTKFQQENEVDASQYQNHPIWGDFLNKNENPTLMVLGDYFFLSEKKQNEEEVYFVRDPFINSNEDFIEIVSSDVNLMERFIVCDFTYLGPGTAESIAPIVPILNLSKNKFFIKLASEFEFEELSRSNIIFSGPFKTVYKFDQIFSKLSMRFNTIPPTLSVVNENGDTTNTFIASGNPRTKYKKDYSVIIKTLGSSENAILLFTGFDEFSVLEAVKYSTHIEFEDQVSNFIGGKLPRFYLLVLETEGINRMTMSSEIKYFQELEATSLH